MVQKIIEQVPLDLIVDELNVRERFDEEPLTGLATTVREHGVQVPLLLVRRRDGKLCLLDGGRRLRAARMAGLKTVPALIEEGELSDAELIQRQFIANCQREDLTPLEKAKAISALIKKTSWSASLTATNLGVSNATVTRLLALLSLPDAIRQRVESGELSASAGYELAMINDAQEQAQLAGQAANGNLTRDAISGARKAKLQTAAGKPASGAPTRVTAMLSGGKSVTVMASGLTLETFIAALEELLSRARQARPKGLVLDTFIKVLRDQSRQ